MNSKKQLFGGKPVMIFRHEHDRRNFLRGAGLIGVGAAFATRLPSDPVAFAQGSASDLEILNYALTLEYLEAEFYKQGIDGGVLSGRELELVTPIGDHEQAHVSAITDTINTLGGTPVAKPMFTFPEGTFTDRTMFLMTAYTFEELGVDAYHGQVANIRSGDVLGAAAAIAGSESRHAAVLANLTGNNPFPAPFEDNKTMEQVLAAAMPFLGGGS
ncbi:MAG: ferritin-like domain-containing protein [Egibacteraceae bacterium]